MQFWLFNVFPFYQFLKSINFPKFFVVIELLGFEEHIYILFIFSVLSPKVKQVKQFSGAIIRFYFIFLCKCFSGPFYVLFCFLQLFLGGTVCFYFFPLCKCFFGPQCILFSNIQAVRHALLIKLYFLVKCQNIIDTTSSSERWISTYLCQNTF